LDQSAAYGSERPPRNVGKGGGDAIGRLVRSVLGHANPATFADDVARAIEDGDASRSVRDRDVRVAFPGNCVIEVMSRSGERFLLALGLTAQRSGFGVDAEILLHVLDHRPPDTWRRLARPDARGVIELPPVVREIGAPPGPGVHRFPLHSYASWRSNMHRLGDYVAHQRVRPAEVFAYTSDWRESGVADHEVGPAERPAGSESATSDWLARAVIDVGPGHGPGRRPGIGRPDARDSDM
jgi:hypothetical protein